MGRFLSKLTWKFKSRYDERPKSSRLISDKTLSKIKFYIITPPKNYTEIKARFTSEIGTLQTSLRFLSKVRREALKIRWDRRKFLVEFSFLWKRKTTRMHASGYFSVLSVRDRYQHIILMIYCVNCDSRCVKM